MRIRIKKIQLTQDYQHYFVAPGLWRKEVRGRMDESSTSIFTCTWNFNISWCNGEIHKYKVINVTVKLTVYLLFQSSFKKECLCFSKEQLATLNGQFRLKLHKKNQILAQKAPCDHGKRMFHNILCFSSFLSQLTTNYQLKHWSRKLCCSTVGEMVIMEYIFG